MAFCETGHVSLAERPKTPTYRLHRQRHRVTAYVTNTDGVIWCLSEEHGMEFWKGLRESFHLPEDLPLKPEVALLDVLAQRQVEFVVRYLGTLKKSRSRL